MWKVILGKTTGLTQVFRKHKHISWKINRMEEGAWNVLNFLSEVFIMKNPVFPDNPSGGMYVLNPSADTCKNFSLTRIFCFVITFSPDQGKVHNFPEFSFKNREEIGVWISFPYWCEIFNPGELKISKDREKCLC